MPSLKRFVEERRTFLLSVPELSKPAPVIQSVACRVPTNTAADAGAQSTASRPAGAARVQSPGPFGAARAFAPKPSDTVQVQARVGGPVKPDRVLLYYAEARTAPFTQVAMFDDGKHGDGAAADGLYAADIPAFPAGTQVHYYVEARAPALTGTTTFSPPRAELGAATYRVASSASAQRTPSVQEPNRKGSPIRPAAFGTKSQPN